MDNFKNLFLKLSILQSSGDFQSPVSEVVCHFTRRPALLWAVGDKFKAYI